MGCASIRYADAIDAGRVIRRWPGGSGLLDSNLNLRRLMRPSCYDRMSRHQRQTSQSEAGDDPLQ